LGIEKHVNSHDQPNNVTSARGSFIVDTSLFVHH